MHSGNIFWENGHLYVKNMYVLKKQSQSHESILNIFRGSSEEGRVCHSILLCPLTPFKVGAVNS